MLYRWRKCKMTINVYPFMIPYGIANTPMVSTFVLPPCFPQNAERSHSFANGLMFILYGQLLHVKWIYFLNFCFLISDEKSTSFYIFRRRSSESVSESRLHICSSVSRHAVFAVVLPLTWKMCTCDQKEIVLFCK